MQNRTHQGLKISLFSAFVWEVMAMLMHMLIAYGLYERSIKDQLRPGEWCTGTGGAHYGSCRVTMGWQWVIWQTTDRSDFAILALYIHNLPRLPERTKRSFGCGMPPPLMAECKTEVKPTQGENLQKHTNSQNSRTRLPPVLAVPIHQVCVSLPSTPF